MGITEQIKSGRDRSLGMQVHMDRLEQLEEMLQKYGTDGQRQAIVIKILNIRVDTARDLVFKIYNKTNDKRFY